MPRPTRRPPATTPTGNTLIASASRLTNSRMARPKNGVADWQREAWTFYDTVGEFRFGCDWLSQACSRARLVIVEESPDGDETTLADGPEVVALEAFFGGDAGQAAALGTLALHRSVPGESYVVGEVRDDPTGEWDEWTIYSNEELIQDRGTGVYRVDRGDGKSRELAEDAVVIRLWDSHPRKWVEATSPARAVLPVLRELEGLTKHVAAAVDSRLAGAGMLLMPSEVSITPPPGVDPADLIDPDTGQPRDLFMDMLTDAMVTPISDRGSASAVVPTVVRAPGALLQHVKHLTFATPLDDKAQALREENLRRLALGMNVPPEVILGLGQSNHWSAWQVDESALKMHVEPLLGDLCGDLTERWLYPAVEAQGAPVNRSRRIGFDTTNLRARPDRTQEAQAVHARLALSDKALRRETGFDEADAPDDREVARRLLLGAAQTPAGPEVSMAAMRALGVALDVPDPVAPPASPPPLPSPEEPEQSTPPPENRRDIPEPAAVLAAAELLVHRAVERAHNRVGRGRQRRPMPVNVLDAALAGAWDNAPRAAALLGLDPNRFVAALDRYARAVLAEGTEHQPRVLERVLSDGG